MDIKLYDKNAKKHPDQQLKLIAKSLKRFGWQQPIKVGQGGFIIAGHGRWLAYEKYGKEMELNEPWVIDEAGNNVMGCAEKRVLTLEEEKAYRLADNKLNESDWDMELVIPELKELDSELFDITGFDADLIIEPDKKDDEVPDVPEEPKSKLGEIYQLGNHRIMCGDSTKVEDVEKLMDGKKAQMCFTDPPYNVDYTGGMGTHEKNERQGIMNDKMSKESFYEFLSEISKRIVENVIGGVYICMSSSEIDTLKISWEKNGGHWQSFIIWVKNNFTLSRADHQHTYEPILYGLAKGIVNHYFIEDRDKPNVWEDLRSVKTEYKNGYTTISFQGYKVRIEGEIKNGEVIKKKQRTDIWRHDKPTKSSEHPTMKPVALCTEALIGSSRKNEIVLDLFLGSGSTLIACEKTNRMCYGMELDPKYVDVIITRWEEYTGNKAIKLN